MQLFLYTVLCSVMKNIAKKTSGKLKLNQLEREFRNMLICHMSRYGMINNQIARIMNVTPSVVSRVIDAEDDSQL